MGIPATDTAIIIAGFADATAAAIAAAVAAERVDDHVHSPQLIYPSLANPLSITSTTGGGTWTPGADTEIIPINTIASIYDIHFISIATVDTNSNIQIDFYKGANGAGAHIFSISATRITSTLRSFSLPVTCPQLPANTRIYAKMADNNDAGVICTFKPWYHVY